MALGWKVLIPGALAWTLLIATLRVWRREGGSTGVYLVGGAIVAALLAVAIGWDVATERAAQRREEADADSLAKHGTAFPVPPLDLPHYHGLRDGEDVGDGQDVTAPADKEVTTSA